MLMIHTWHIETIPATACTPTQTRTHTKKKRQSFFFLAKHSFTSLTYCLLEIGIAEERLLSMRIL